MKEIMPRMELIDLQKRIKEFLKSSGFESAPVEIKEDSETDTFIISAGTLNMKGLYPTIHNDVFTIYLIDGTKTMDSGISVEYVEAIVFKTDQFTPYQYIIYCYPQTQTTYLVEDGCHKKGSIVYHNSCPCGCGNCNMQIDKPILNPKGIGWSKFL